MSGYREKNEKKNFTPPHSQIKESFRIKCSSFRREYEYVIYLYLVFLVICRNQPKEPVKMREHHGSGPAICTLSYSPPTPSFPSSLGSQGPFSSCTSKNAFSQCSMTQKQPFTYVQLHIFALVWILKSEQNASILAMHEVSRSALRPIHYENKIVPGITFYLNTRFAYFVSISIGIPRGRYEYKSRLLLFISYIHTGTVYVNRCRNVRV